MAIPQGFNTSFTIFRGFNAASPISISGSPIAANGFLKQNTELGRFGLAPDGLYWTTVIDVLVGTDARDAWDSYQNTYSPTSADTVLVQDYPIPGWCTPFLVVMVERIGRQLGSDRYRLYLDRCQPVAGTCPTSGGVSVTCCPSADIPTTLHLTVTDDGSCHCLDGTFTLTWNPTWTLGSTVGAWLSTILSPCGFDFIWSLQCNPFNGKFDCNIMTKDFEGHSFTDVNDAKSISATFEASATPCDPFMWTTGGITWSMSGQLPPPLQTNCTGAISAVITE